MKVEATYSECQYMDIHGKKPISLIEREQLAKSEDVRMLIDVRDDLLGISKDKELAERRLKQLLTESELLKLEQQVAEERELERERREYPFHKGGGYWQLSNGKTVRGEAKAIESEIKLINQK